MKWISTKDRLPKNKDFVLVWDSLVDVPDAMGVDMSTASYVGNGEWEDYIGNPHSYSDHIKFWMPLPKQPKH